MKRLRHDDLAWVVLTLLFTVIGVMIGVTLGAWWWR